MKSAPARLKTKTSKFDRSFRHCNAEINTNPFPNVPMMTTKMTSTVQTVSVAVCTDP
uniref:Uncharacterized protein n=1 Tax=Arion vulgaris TaxID=1028688 RepID=A0A0B6Z0S2_9EUPU